MSSGVPTGIVAAHSSPIDAWVQLGVASGRVISVSFPSSEPPAAGEDHVVLDRLLAYLRGDAQEDFGDVEIALTTSTEERKVLEAVREIGYGSELTPDGVAAVAAVESQGSDERKAAVAAALRNNPMPILIPDHRVTEVTGATPPNIRAHCRSLERLT